MLFLLRPVYTHLQQGCRCTCACACGRMIHPQFCACMNNNQYCISLSCPLPLFLSLFSSLPPFFLPHFLFLTTSHLSLFSLSTSFPMTLSLSLPLPFLYLSSLPLLFSPSPLLLFHSFSQAKWNFADNTRNGHLFVTILRTLHDKQ